MRTLILIFAFLAVSPAGAAAPSEFQQKIACTGDAFRLCASDIPDRMKIRACMAREHARLSDGCRRVFDASVAAGQ